MSFLSKKTFFVALISVIIGGVLLAIFTQIIREGSPIDKDGVERISPPESNIGKTTVEELRDRQGLISEEQIGENAIKFEFESGIYLHPDTVIAEEGVAVYESVSVNVDEFNEANYPKIIDFLGRYGDPGLIIQGSARYGPFVRTYVYPDLGFSLIGNPATDEILEFEYFTPMQSQEYTDKYGEGIRQIESHQHAEEHI